MERANKLYLGGILLLASPLWYITYGAIKHEITGRDQLVESYIDYVIKTEHENLEKLGLVQDFPPYHFGWSFLYGMVTNSNSFSFRGEIYFQSGKLTTKENRSRGNLPDHEFRDLQAVVRHELVHTWAYQHCDVLPNQGEILVEEGFAYLMSFQSDCSDIKLEVNGSEEHDKSEVGHCLVKDIYRTHSVGGICYALRNAPTEEEMNDLPGWQKRTLDMLQRRGD